MAAEHFDIVVVGSGFGGSVAAESVPWMGHPHSVSLTLPPLGALFLLPER